MKKTSLIAFTLASMLPATAVLAQQKMDQMKGLDMSKKSSASSPMAISHKAIGVVKATDAKAGTVTLAHEPIESLNWPAMTMGFLVRDKMLLDKLALGKKIEFEFVQESKGYVVTAVK
ncbi:MAG: copper-binding protein [Cupriavidus necator]